MPRDIALYIHVPFCRRKCRYCSFISYEHRSADIPGYIQALKNELKQRSDGETVNSVYFGGGTPSLLPAGCIEELLTAIGTLFVLDNSAEITMEANPGTVDKAYLKAIRSIGINRLSLGVQSFNDKELKTLGRIHNAGEAREAVKTARAAGFSNLNLDLIYGLPGQTVTDWKCSLEEAAALGPEHLSLYALTLEPETLMAKDFKEGLLPEIDPDISADQYELAEELLAKYGYRHYEISNWAREGKECRHNLTYWKNLPYLGIGAAAHSCINGKRFANTTDLDKYLSGLSVNILPSLQMEENISPELELAESVILGLRLGEGISKDRIEKRFSVNILDRYGDRIKEMTDAGLMIQTSGNIKLTPRGRLLSNEVFWRFLPET